MNLKMCMLFLFFTKWLYSFLNILLILEAGRYLINGFNQMWEWGIIWSFRYKIQDILFTGQRPRKVFQHIKLYNLYIISQHKLYFL